MPKTYFPKTNDDELASLLKRIAALEARIQKEQEGLTDEKRKNVAGGIVLDFMALIRPTASLTLGFPACAYCETGLAGRPLLPAGLSRGLGL